MKPARIALTHCLVLHYGLHKKMQVNITTKVVCLYRLLKFFSSFLTSRSSLTGSTLFASILKLVNNVMQLYAADNISDAFLLAL